jgi:Protein of unknown function (DUF3431)
MRLASVTFHPGRHRTFLTVALCLVLILLFGLLRSRQPPAFYAKTLVIAHRQRENISWTDSLPQSVTRAIYCVDDTSSNSTLPANKGREAMVYLTYIIDHYPNFPQIVLFFHAKDIAWHNNILLDNSSLSTILHMSDDRVMRNGYFNSRCHHYPGCPEGLQLNRPIKEIDEERLRAIQANPFLRASLDATTGGVERYLNSSLWNELHPGTPVPDRLSQPCSAQFAVSRQAILRHDLADYVRWRDWLLNTQLHDRISGRVFEYMWQYIFTGKSDVCPSELECFCDGYGLCFEEGQNGLKEWIHLKAMKKKVEVEIYYLRYNNTEYVATVNDTLHKRRDELETQLQSLRETAYRRGEDPAIRAHSVQGF